MPAKIDYKWVPNILAVGTGEYTTGFVNGKPSPDKPKGVVGLVLFNERRLGNIGDLFMAGVDGTKFPGIRRHLQEQIGEVYKDMDVSFVSFPADDKKDDKAYIAAMDIMSPGDGVIIFTPDHNHYEIACAAIERGLHVLIAKPPVQKLEHHRDLISLAQQKGVLVDIEVHKRFDQSYANARKKFRKMGGLTHFSSYMAQQKGQIHSFVKWAGLRSDISYYLNAHHVDTHVWFMEGMARPSRVTAIASYGIASRPPFSLPPKTEDTITLTVTWPSVKYLETVRNAGITGTAGSSGSIIVPADIGTAVYTAGWVEPKSEVYTRQGFVCLGRTGRVAVDQCMRGYWVATDDGGAISGNPFYMDVEPGEDGFFDGERGYGYVSIAKFVEALGQMLNEGKNPEDFESRLPTIRRTLPLTAILEAGRRSLDNCGAPVDILYNDRDGISTTPIGLRGYSIVPLEEHAPSP